MTKKGKNPAFTLLLAICIACASFQGCSKGSFVFISGYAQGGVYSVKCRIPAMGMKQARSGAEALKSGIDSILNVIDCAVSGYNDSSVLSIYNRGGDISSCRRECLKVFDAMTVYCDSIATATSGVVDTRAATLFDIWGFGFKNDTLPSDEAVIAAMDDRSRMNFNAVAQGFSSDLIAGYLRGNGIRDFLVDIGGEMICDGENPRGKNWTFAIDTPSDGNMTPGRDISGIFEVTRRPCAVVTSGNYRKFYIRDGVKYSHTIDPRTGYPVQHNLLSATIIAPTAALADAMATYCMVIGPEAAMEFIESRTDLEGCLISSDGIWTSKGLTLKSNEGR